MTVATFNDRLYGVPLYADVSALFYNKDLFEQAGLDPNKPPTSLAEMREYADKITALGDDIKGYYLPGNCAGCNIFTVGPLMWASDATIEAGMCGDEPLVGDGVKEVLQFARDMVKAGNVPASAQTENGETFHLQFGSGKLGMMGTGNFNITLARDQMKGHEFEFGIACCRASSRARPPRSSAATSSSSRTAAQRVDDAVDVHEVPAVGRDQVEVYAKALNLTTRSDMADNEYFEAEPLVQDVAKALEVGHDAVHADVLRADQLAAGSVAADAPAGLLHRRRPRHGHRRRQAADEGHRLRRDRNG